jgi:hypothetical protein
LFFNIPLNIFIPGINHLLSDQMIKKSILFAFFLVLLYCYGYTQIIVSHNSPQSISRQSDLLNLNIENNIGISTYAYIEIEISEENYGYLGIIKTDKFLLPVGPSILDPGMISIASRSFLNLDYANSIKTTGSFMPGKYKANISLKSATDNNSLTLSMVSFNVAKLSSPSDSISTNNDTAKKKGNNSNFKMSGNAEVLGYYSYGQPSTTLTPPTYLQMSFNPQFSLFDVPIGAKIFITTQQNTGLQSMNYFRLNFDANAFRGMMMKRLMDLINKKANLGKMNLSNFDSYKDQLSGINNTLKNPGVLQEMAQIKELDSLKQQFGSYKDKLNVSDTSFMKYFNSMKDSLSSKLDSIPKLDSLKSTYNDSIGKIKDTLMSKYEKMAQMYEKIKSMNWLEEKKKYYDQLTEKKDQIMGYGQKLGCIDSLGNYTSKIENFDAKKYSDPSTLYTALKSNKLFKKFEKYLFWIKSVNIGMHSPVYSNLSLNGVNVNGFGIELEPQKFYFAFNYGQVLRPVITTNLVNANYQRNLWSFKLGYGRLEDSHIHLSILSATDDSSSVNPRDSLYLYNKLPQDNKVISVDFKLVLFKKKLSISGEIAGSQTIKDLTFNSSLYNFLPSINGNNPGANTDNWFVNIFTQSNSGLNRQVDYAVQCKMEGRFFEGSTITASFSRVGPQFQSFGLPFLVKDRMIGEFKAAQKFWKNRISVSGFFRYNVDNLDSTKTLTTQFLNYGFDLRLNIPKFPSLAVSYTPVTLQNDSAVINMNILNANCFHTFNLKKFSINGILNYIYQSSTQSNTTGNIFNLHNINLTTIFNFGKFSINNSLTYMNNKTITQTTNTFISSISTSFTLFKKWTNTVGGNIYSNDNSIKGGGFYQTSLSVVKNLVFNIRLETNRFNTYLFLPGYQDYTQFFLRTSIQYKW